MRARHPHRPTESPDPGSPSTRPVCFKKFGVSPESIPDYLALVGDAADGYPGLPGWGAKSSAAVLANFRHLESIPSDSRDGGLTSLTRGPSPPRFSANASAPCSSERSPPSGRTSRSSTTSISCAGRAPTADFEALAARLDAATGDSDWSIRWAQAPADLMTLAPVLVAGATGQLGGAIATKLIAAGVPVRSLAIAPNSSSRNGGRRDCRAD